MTTTARFLLSALVTALVVTACGPATEPAPDAGETPDAGQAVAPTIETFTPFKGPALATVTLTGTGFSATAAENAVTFLGADGTDDDKAATVTAATATELQVTVPEGAVTGRISVTVNGLTGTTAAPFQVGIPLKLRGSVGLGVPATADSSFSMMLEGSGLTAATSDYTLVGAPIFGGETTPFTVMNVGTGFISVAAPLVPGTFRMHLAFRGETAIADEPVQVYDWRYIHDFFNGVTRGEPFVKGAAGQEVRVGFSPGNPDQGSYTIELLDAETGALVHSQVPNGSSGSPSGTFAVSYRTHTGPVGTFRARVKFVSAGENPVTSYTTVSAATLTIQDAAP